MITIPYAGSAGVKDTWEGSVDTEENYLLNPKDPNYDSSEVVSHNRFCFSIMLVISIGISLSFYFFVNSCNGLMKFPFESRIMDI